MPAHNYCACDNSQVNKVYFALDLYREGKGSKLFSDDLGMNIRTDLQGNDSIYLVLIESVGHYSVAARIFCERRKYLFSSL